jgi:hypothetical protein
VRSGIGPDQFGAIPERGGGGSTSGGRMMCPGCPPSNANHKQIQNTDFQDFAKHLEIFVAIVRIARNSEHRKEMQKLCGRIPRAYTCSYLFALQEFWQSTAGHLKNKSGNESSQNPLLLIQKG